MKSKFLLSFLSFLIVTSIHAQGDDCSNALPLTNLSNYCSGASQYTNVGSTVSGWSAESCWSGTPLNDVWFSFVSTGTDVLISVNGSTMMRPRIALYYGSCSGTLNSVVAACSNGTIGSPDSQAYAGGLTQGQTYYIRVSTGASNTGTFQLCINNYIPPVSASADCGGAGVLCNKNSLSVAGLSGGGANNTETTGTCMSGPGYTESNSVWYTWTCGTSGTLTFDLTPGNQSDDIDFAIFQLTTTDPCGPRSVIRCSAASCTNATASTGLNMNSTDVSEAPGCSFPNDAYVQYIDMVAGTSYAMIIDNATATNGFTINWGGTGTFQGPLPQITGGPFTTCVGVPFSFDGSTSTNYNSLSWNFNNGGGSPSTATGPGPVSVTYATAGTYTAILNGTSAAGCTSVNSVQVTVNPYVTPTFNSVANVCQDATAPVLPTTSLNGISGSWSPTVSTATVGTESYDFTPTMGQCANTTSLTITVVAAGITPTFNNVGPYCSGSSIPALPTTSLNSINGAWSPAIDNTTTTNYTFLPTVGQCATSATLTIDITAPPAPTFDAVGPYCIGATISALPTNSNNSITGLWSPPIDNSNTTLYTFAPNPGECGTSATMTININPLPTIDAGNDLTICEGQSITLAGSGGTTYLWNNGVVNGTSFTPALGGATYTVVGTDSNGCSNSAEVVVDVVLAPVASIDADQTSGIHSLSVNFSNSSINSNSYSWDFGNGTSTSNTNGVSYTFPTGTYNVVLTASNGVCTDTDLIQIIVVEYADPIINIPNVFTPNNDGSNDFFFIDAQLVESISYIVINRWGELIFEGEGINPQWNGEDKSGRLMDDGVFFVKYEITGLNGKLYSGHGNISLVR